MTTRTEISKFPARKIAIIYRCQSSFANQVGVRTFTIKEEGGIEGTFLGASIIFYGYLGFDFITTLSEDSKNPVKDIPIAVMFSSLICTVLYFLTAISLVGMARIETLNPETAMADAFYHVNMPYATIIIYICAFFGITAACFTNFIVSGFYFDFFV